MPSFDPEVHRLESRDRWEAVAGGWELAAELFHTATLPVSHWMIDHLQPQPGQRILELAAGRGDLGFLTAELLHPGGVLISTDGAEAMVEVARRYGEALGARGVEYRPMELEWLDEPAATLDGILCRFGYMHAADPEAALRDARRVLRQGGRLVIAVWAAAEHNPWLAALAQALQEAGHVPVPAPDVPGAFALSGADGAMDVGEAIEDAGFDVPLIEPIELTFRAPTLDAWWDTVKGMSSSMRPVIEALSPADHYVLRDAVEARWAPYVGADGTVAIPGRALGVSTEA
jgi:SAM-dependent methyltransferase